MQKIAQLHEFIQCVYCACTLHIIAGYIFIHISIWAHNTNFVNIMRPKKNIILETINKRSSSSGDVACIGNAFPVNFNLLAVPLTQRKAKENWINFLISATILSKQCMHFEQLNHLVCIIDSLCNFASKFRYLLFD